LCLTKVIQGPGVALEVVNIHEHKSAVTNDDRMKNHPEKDL